MDAIQMKRARKYKSALGAPDSPEGRRALTKIHRDIPNAAYRLLRSKHSVMASVSFFDFTQAIIVLRGTLKKYREMAHGEPFFAEGAPDHVRSTAAENLELFVACIENTNAYALHCEWAGQSRRRRRPKLANHADPECEGINLELAAAHAALEKCEAPERNLQEILFLARELRASEGLRAGDQKDAAGKNLVRPAVGSSHEIAREEAERRPDSEPPPDDAIASKEILDAIPGVVEDAIDTAIIACKLQAMTDAEIERELGLSKGTVAYRLKRMRPAVARLLGRKASKA